jgi:hypothetical protein
LVDEEYFLRVDLNEKSSYKQVLIWDEVPTMVEIATF